MEKEVLDFQFDGIKKTIWLEAEKRDALLLMLSKWIRGANKGQRQYGIGAIVFKEFQPVTSKIRHSFISIPQKNRLFSPVNRILALEPELVFLHQNPKILIAIKDMKKLLRESNLSPTNFKELISDWPDYIGVKYASGHGIGSVVFGENLPCTPTVFCTQWPEWVKIETISSSNSLGTFKKSDL